MKVKCITTHQKPTTQKKLSLFDTPLINWDVKIGVSYTIYGISLWEHVLHYLLVTENSEDPDWFPAELFEVVDGTLPRMYYAYLENDPRGLNALWSYEEMVTDYHHYVDLIEREEQALQVFFRRKREYDRLVNDAFSLSES